jgi:tetratricopeptide (TPR) repeat protein
MSIGSESSTEGRSSEQPLDSWKQIASFLRTSVRSVQRWEKTEGLPVHRHQHAKLGSVYAYRSELERWRAGRGLGEMGTAAIPRSGSAIEDWQAEVSAAVMRLDRRVQPVLGAAAVGNDPDFVGRRAELDELRRTYDQREVGLVTVGGDPGLGKSRLLDVFLDDLAQSGERFTVARGHCSERLAGTEAFVPVLEALESLVEGVGGDDLAALTRLVAPTWYVQVAPLWATADPAFESILEEARAASPERMKRELAALVRAVASARPLVVVLDDMHWADPSTVELLAYVAKKVTGVGFLVLMAYRTSELVLNDPPFRAAKHELEERGLSRDLVLEFLTRDEVVQYLRAVCPDNLLEPALVDFLHERTGGSPLFLAELVRHLVDRRVLLNSSEGWRLEAPIDSLADEIPQSVRSMVERKLDRLELDDRELLSVAAVEGNEFETAVVAAVLERSPADIEAALQRIARLHRLLVPIAERELAGGCLSLRYRFVHVLYQNALFDAVAPSRRRSLGVEVAQQLMRCHGERWNLVASQVALLFESGAEFAAASDALLVAARQASRLYANEESVRLGHRAMANAERLEPAARHPRVLAAARHVADVCHLSGRYHEAIEASETAAKAARELGDVEAEVDAIGGASTALFFLKDLDRSYAAAKHAHDIAEAAGNQSALATADAMLAREHMALGQLDEAESYFDGAVAVLRTKETQTAQSADAVGFKILLHAWRLEYDRVEEVTAWWTKQVARLDVHFVTPHFYLGMAFGNQGRLGEAIEVVTEGFRLADLNNDPWHVCRFPNTLGWISREIEDREDALRLDEQSVAIAAQLGYQEAEANAHVNMARGLTEFGEHDAALAHLRKAEQLFQEDTWFRWRYNIRLQAELAHHYLAVENLADAKVHATKGLELAITARAPKYIASAHARFAEMAILEDRPKDAWSAFTASLAALDATPCPTLSWRIQARYAAFADQMGDAARADRLRAECGATIKKLAGSLRDDAARTRFLKSEAVVRTVGKLV